MFSVFECVVRASEKLHMPVTIANMESKTLKGMYIILQTLEGLMHLL